MTQERAVLFLLRSGPKTTEDFIRSMFGLAAEYRRVISNLRKKGYVITATKITKKCWRYTLIQEPMKIEPNGQLVLGLVGTVTG